MQVEIKSISSVDAHDLSSFVPEDPECFSLDVRIMMGPYGAEGEESFDIEICTPKWLEKSYPTDSIVMGRHMLIVQDYHFSRISGFIRAYVAKITGDSWDEIALKLSRLGHWEFEDYVE